MYSEKTVRLKKLLFNAWIIFPSMKIYFARRKSLEAIQK